MKSYPIDHKEIVGYLLNGKFLIYPNPLFLSLLKQDEEYKEFFKVSFGYDLILDAEFAYLASTDTNEKRTRDFTLFLAILCRELDYSGKNFKDLIDAGTFEISETEQLLKASSKWEILERTSVANFDEFIDTWHKRNILIRYGNHFKFTKAIKAFFEFAINVAKAKMAESKAIGS